MKEISKIIYKSVFLSAVCVLLFYYFQAQQPVHESIRFPYKKAGLTSRQAAAHLLSRFTYGATPGQVDAVAEMGIEKWFQLQLNAGLPDDSLNAMLDKYDAIKLTNAEVVSTFPRPAQVLRRAIADGVINKDSVNKSDKKEYQDKLSAYMEQNGLRPQKELYRQFFNQKIIRAAYSNNQLQEVLTDFWFNHFNVSITKNDCAEFIPAYERDVIRPNVFNKFSDLLLATAKSPAMLLYLDNFNSSGASPLAQAQGAPQRLRKMTAEMDDLPGDTTSQKAILIKRLQNAKKSQGLNENYAREVMELHTLGVDGGYTQQDVTQAAKVLTGWTIFPMGDNGYGNAAKKLLERAGEDKLKERGFVHEGDFLFAMNRHDNQEKKVLGKVFPANGGYEEGVQLLTMLAQSESAARFISKKLAVRFVSDNPQQSLIDKMVKTFISKNGDVRQVLITMVSSPEFWARESLREKTKSPFELAISTVRSLGADIRQPFQLYNWIAKMGQKMYFYQAPTGFPDKGQYWINTGALLNRMNFGLAIASQRIPGISFDLVALNNHHEPESAEAALLTYGRLMMPERDLEQTVKRLAPLLNDPELEKKVDEAAAKTASPSNSMDDQTTMMTNNEGTRKNDNDKIGKKGLASKRSNAMEGAPGNNNMLSQVVGIIIGSPEFQRR